MLDRHLATHTYMAGDCYTIADMAIWPWYGALVQNKVYVCVMCNWVMPHQHISSPFTSVRRNCHHVGRLLTPPTPPTASRYEAAEFLAVHEYKHVLRWTELIASRPAGGAPCSCIVSVCLSVCLSFMRKSVPCVLCTNPLGLILYTPYHQ